MPDVHLSTFARRLLDIADDAADLRQSPDARVKLAAMRTEREALAELSGRLGFDDTEAVEDLAVMTAALQAVAAALLKVDPVLTERVAELIDAHHDDNLSELAQLFRDNMRDRQQQLITAPSTRSEITQ
ncbi:hypothetical protein [Modestobacter sp. Leaf380]|uniref:hypothetical protein n=1 Tax=Modestobacter sp. Leaf380 TaxID=1736356 RepID=UPI0012FB82F6|nr:hypothetical protein [Modestobacter sp. Leaf380]